LHLTIFFSREDCKNSKLERSVFYVAVGLTLKGKEKVEKVAKSL
jgi:hypothetical protein